MLTVYNTLSRQKEEFIPLQDQSVSMYVCGITPYDTTHLGHAFTYIFFDIVYRYLTFKGYKVTYTQNVTDINDRDNDILKRAKEQNTSWQDLANFWTKRFLDDMKELNWVMPTYYLKASEHIRHMVELTQKILANGYAYEVNGSVYLNTEKVNDFGKLSNFSKEQMLETAKKFEEDLENKDKKHPLDITLWRASAKNQPEHIPSFQSPFGNGRPGWHIECSAMSTEKLGEKIDIHGGGIDLIYPHHESEIAESEAATGKKPFAKYWFHTGIVGYQGKKMSKSVGNLVLVSDLLKKYSPNAIRYLLLSRHYRSLWDYKESDLGEAEKVVMLFKEKATEDLDMAKEFIDAMEDDFNTPLALSILQKQEAISLKALSLLGFIV